MARSLTVAIVPELSEVATEALCKELSALFTMSAVDSDEPPEEMELHTAH